MADTEATEATEAMEATEEDGVVRVVAGADETEENCKTILQLLNINDMCLIKLSTRKNKNFGNHIIGIS